MDRRGPIGGGAAALLALTALAAVGALAYDLARPALTRMANLGMSVRPPSIRSLGHPPSQSPRRES
jgi:hypothetical protein